jgi:5-methylcytosine-specific restriction endonuclease McrA
MMSRDLHSAYFFDLRMVCGGYAYYVTYTVFNAFTTAGRELRKPDPVNVKVFSESAKLFRQRLSIIQSVEEYNDWLYLRGWAIVELNMAKSNMRQWLKSAECIKAPTHMYTDIEIVSPSALKHHTKQSRKKHVLDRDKQTCLACGSTRDDGVRLTMQHVRPHSKGGETTAQNLVTLCEPCNRKRGTEEITELYKKAGLHFGYDPSIIQGRLSDEIHNQAIELSDNLMQTRCEIW